MSKISSIVTYWSLWAENSKLTYILHSSIKCKKIVIMIHWLKSCKDSYTYQQFQSTCSKKWVDSIRFDMNGHWESYGLLENFSINQWVKDVQRICSFVKDLWYEEIILFWNSVWWCIALRIASNNNAIKLVLISAPWNKKESYDELYTLCENIYQPVQIVHWMLDDIVPYEVSLELYTHLQYSFLWLLPFWDHSFSWGLASIRNNIFSQSLKWLYTQWVFWVKIKPTVTKKSRILLIKNWLIWLAYIRKFKHHIMIWWTVDEWETTKETIHRETKEESWYQINSLKYLSTTSIQTPNQSIESICYISDNISHISNPNYTENEVDLWLSVKRYTIDEAIRKVKLDQIKTSSKMWKFFSAESLIILSKYKKEYVLF